jgi:hypothetical protein
MNITPRLTALRYEVRVLGPALFAVPVLAALSLSGLVGVLAVRNVSHDFLPQLVTGILEALLPLTAGVVLATVAAHDPAIELQLTLPTLYRFTAGQRFALLLGWTLLVEAVVATALHLILPWAQVKHGAGYILLWLAPTLWLAAAGALLALLMRSRATAGALLGSIWVAQLVFHGYFALSGWTQPWFLFATLFAPGAAFWPTNRVELILIALALSLGVWAFLLNSEWRFRGEDV